MPRKKVLSWQKPHNVAHKDILHESYVLSKFGHFYEVIGLSFAVWIMSNSSLANYLNLDGKFASHNEGVIQFPSKYSTGHMT